jgi:heme exporter protein CcmB
MRFLRHVGIVAWKDLRVELRTREILYTSIFFATMVVLLFTFPFLEVEEEEAASPRVILVRTFGNPSAAILWIAVAFAGLLALGRAFDREREGDTMRGLLLSPADRGALFLGKAIGVMVFLLIVEAIVVPLIGFFFQAPVLEHVGLLALLLFLASVGFAVVGSSFAAMLMRARMREVLLPVILYPILVPLLMAGAKGTAALFQDQPAPAIFWAQFLLVFDLVFLTVALWAFESLVIE